MIDFDDIKELRGIEEPFQVKQEEASSISTAWPVTNEGETDLSAMFEINRERIRNIIDQYIYRDQF